MRPSEPFVTEFLSGEWRNITADQVNREIYPLGTYSYMAQLVIIFLITDMLRYKPIIILSACLGIIMWALLLWTYTMLGLQFTQLCYGSFMAAEVAYYTYMYAKVNRENYQQVTGQTRSAILAGRFLASVLAQVMVSYSLLDLRELNYISFSAQIASLFFALILPSAETSLYFYRIGESSHNLEAANYDTPYPITTHNKQGDDTSSQADLNSSKELELRTDADKSHLKAKFSCKRAIDLLWSHFTEAYTNAVVIQWSLWWALAMCGYLLVQSYVQLLWKEIDSDQENFFNGAVEAVLTLLSACGTFAAGFLNSSKYQKWDLWILTICSGLEGGFILWSALTTSIWVAYISYIFCGTLYNFMITIASATVAKKLQDDSFALIFGINTLVAVVLQSIMTVIVISESGFSLSARGQFVVFGGYFLVLSVVYALAGLVLSFAFKTKTER